MSPEKTRWAEMAKHDLLAEIAELRLFGYACNAGFEETRKNRFRRRIARKLLKVAIAAVKAAKVGR